MISIITTFYNTEIHFIEKLYESVIGQTFTNWEWVITDDFSSNLESSELVKSLPKRDGRIRYIEQESKKEIFWNPHKYAKGDTITHIDSDDYFVPKSLEVINYFFNKYPDVVLITTELNNFKGSSYSGSLYFDYENYKSLWGWMENEKNDPSIEKDMFSDCFILGYCRSWRNINVDFNPDNKIDIRNIVNDFVHLMKMEEYGKYLHIPRALYMYITREDSITRKLDESNNFLSDTAAINNEIRERRKTKDINSFKRIFQNIHWESMALLNHEINSQRTSKKLSFISENILKLSQKESFSELYFDHKIYFNDYSDDMDYYVIHITNNGQFEYFKNVFEKVRFKKLSIQFTFKDGTNGDLFHRIKNHILSMGHGFYWADYNNKYLTITL
jgi:hypothetical protein